MSVSGLLSFTEESRRLARERLRMCMLTTKGGLWRRVWRERNFEELWDFLSSLSACMIARVENAVLFIAHHSIISRFKWQSLPSVFNQSATPV